MCIITDAHFLNKTIFKKIKQLKKVLLEIAEARFKEIEK